MRSSMPFVLADDIQALDLVQGADNALGQAEADRKILEVGRRRHHDCVGRAVIDEGDRHLLRDAAVMVHDGLRRDLRRTGVDGSVAHGAIRPLPPARCAGLIGRTPRTRPDRSVGPLDGRDLHRRHLVLGAVGGPVGKVRGDHVGLRQRVVERRVDDTRRYAVRDERAQGRLAGAAAQCAPSRRP